MRFFDKIKSVFYSLYSEQYDEAKSPFYNFLYGRSLFLPRSMLLACAYFGPASFIVLQLGNYGRACGTLQAVKEFSGQTSGFPLNSPVSQIFVECINSKTNIAIGVVLFVALHLFLKMAVLLRPKRTNESYASRNGGNRSNNRKSYSQDD